MEEPRLDKHDGRTVLLCRGLLRRGEPASSTSRAIRYDDLPADVLSGEFGPILGACKREAIFVVGPRPKKEIDALLTGRVLVIGDDSDLNAVVLRLLRKELLGSVEIAYAPGALTAITDLYALPTGAEAVQVALRGDAEPIPLVRNDSGGVLVGMAQLAPMTGTFYVDAQRVPGGRAAAITVQPEPSQGVAVTVARRRPWGLGHSSATYTGRAVEFGIVPSDGTTITFDGIRHPREVNRWVFYRHTEPLRLVREQ